MAIVMLLSPLVTRRPDPLFSRRRWQKPWPPSRLFIEERRKAAMAVLPFSLGRGRADLLFSRRYAMTTLTALY
jgi:hypothetical protein